ncbi:MAG: ATP-binding cassette domain-containing protein, partial [Terriglobales bacterium]
MGTLLAIRGLEVELGGRRVLQGIGLEVPEGGSVALVGESGGGKSTLLRACMGLLPPGSILGGELQWSPAGTPPVDLLAASPAAWRRLRGAQLALIPQEPSAALDPRRRAGALLRECMGADRRIPRAARGAAAAAALAAVGIGADRARAYPHQWSGGMQQRLLVAMALARRPRLV